MAYIYKTVLRAENHVFDICQNRSNSKEISILVSHKNKDYDYRRIGVIQNKTNKVVIMNTFDFKAATIEKLRKRLS